MKVLRITSFLQGACLGMLFLFSVVFASAQEVGEVEIEGLTNREWNLSLFLNTSGGGIGFQQGRTPDYYRKHFYEIDFLFNHHGKAVRGKSTYFQEATPYSYGKLCDLFFLRAGYGYQKVIAHKPYWGGVQVKWGFSGGFSLGLAMPVYLYVAVPDNSNYYDVDIQRYDPENPIHTIDNIIGRAPFFKGIGKTGLHPGFYGKLGVQFDFAKNSKSIQALEIGLTVDMVFPFVKQMADNKAKPFFLCGYIAYCFGKKKEPYE